MSSSTTHLYPTRNLWSTCKVSCKDNRRPAWFYCSSSQTHFEVFQCGIELWWTIYHRMHCGWQRWCSNSDKLACQPSQNVNNVQRKIVSVVDYFGGSVARKPTKSFFRASKRRRQISGTSLSHWQPKILSERYTISIYLLSMETFVRCSIYIAHYCLLNATTGVCWDF